MGILSLPNRVNLDRMQEWIFPKLEKDDQVTSLLVSKSWGKTIMEEIWQPNMS